MTRLLTFLERPAAVPAIVAALMTAFWAIRTTLLDGLGGDEAEQVLFAQSLRWGYDTANPPLYTWLLIGLFDLFGKSASLVLAFKFAILGAVYIALHFTARRALGPERSLDAALAALSPLLLFFVGWYALFSYSHSLLNALFVILTFGLALRLAGDGRWRVYAALGVVVGLGVLTKYSFSLFLLGLLVAGLTLSETRARILSPRLFLSIAIAVSVVAPHALWLAGSLAALRDAVVYKLEIDAATPWLTGVGQGLVSLGRALFAFLSPLWLVVLLAFPTVFRLRPASPEHSLAAALLGRSFAVTLAALVLMVLAGGVTHFRGNYLFLLILAPLWVFARIPVEARLDRRRKAYAGALAAAAVLALGVLAAKPFVDPARCRQCQELVPYDALAEELVTRGFAGGSLYANWYPLPLAGNLVLHLDTARAISSKFPNIRPSRAEEPGQCLLIWVPVEQGGYNTRTLRILAFQVFNADVPEDTPVTRLELPIPRAREKKILVDFMLLDPGPGECR